ncbi:hypothetical protein T4B_6583 [Trichinella pseudospiralis]|uniref:Uncharacterized protein n=1 Tax=Trichinella pseudospiralis TaxID=6337 RepID=A0A0V1FJ66_TRIPS|nr:hypothetical protein T4B_6583 [Trichinella pseudospiralis]
MVCSKKNAKMVTFIGTTTVFSIAVFVNSDECFIHQW